MDFRRPPRPRGPPNNSCRIQRGGNNHHPQHQPRIINMSHQQWNAHNNVSAFTPPEEANAQNYQHQQQPVMDGYNSYPYPAMPSPDMMATNVPTTFPAYSGQMYIAPPSGHVQPPQMYMNSLYIQEAPPHQPPVATPSIIHAQPLPHNKVMQYNSKENLMTCSHCQRKNYLAESEFNNKEDEIKRLTEENEALRRRLQELEQEKMLLASQNNMEDDALETIPQGEENSEFSLGGKLSKLSADALEFNPKSRKDSATSPLPEKIDNVPVVSLKGKMNDEDSEPHAVLFGDSETQTEEECFEEVIQSDFSIDQVGSENPEIVSSVPSLPEDVEKNADSPTIEEASPVQENEEQPSNAQNTEPVEKDLSTLADSKCEDEKPPSANNRLEDQKPLVLDRKGDDENMETNSNMTGQFENRQFINQRNNMSRNRRHQHPFVLPGRGKKRCDQELNDNRSGPKHHENLQNRNDRGGNQYNVSYNQKQMQNHSNPRYNDEGPKGDMRENRSRDMSKNYYKWRENTEPLSKEGGAHQTVSNHYQGEGPRGETRDHRQPPRDGVSRNYYRDNNEFSPKDGGSQSIATHQGKAWGKNNTNFREENREPSFECSNQNEESQFQNSRQGYKDNGGREKQRNFNRTNHQQQRDFDQKYTKDIVKEFKGDLFSCPSGFSLAHCVAKDLRMGSGIAVKFKSEFKRVGELMDQNVDVGGCAYLKDNDRYIFYLVTKTVSNGKPTYDTLTRSLESMKELCKKFNVTKLAMPRIGCGLDKLDWLRVKSIINEVFQNINMEIHVYEFNVEGLPESEGNKAITLSVRHTIKNLVNIEVDTALVFFGSEDGFMDPTARSLNEKFRFELEYKKAEKCVGKVVRIEKKDVLYCLIVAKSYRENVLFTNVESCVKELVKMLKKDEYFYVGVEVIQGWSQDDIFTEKFISILRNMLPKKMQLWVCFPNAEMDVHGMVKDRENTK